MEILRLFEEDDYQKIEKSCNIIGLDFNNAIILDHILKYIFEMSNKITSEKTFDYDLDFKYYYADFKEYGIDLIEQDIDWFRFSSILTKIMYDKRSMLSAVIEYRTYKKPSTNYKTAENEIHKIKNELKRQFALPQKHKNIDEGLGKLWGYAEERGKTNE